MLISTNKAPKPVAPYNQAVLVDRTLYVSGCLGLNKDTMKLVEGDVSIEARQAFKNLGIILQEAGSSFDKVVKSTVLLQDINDFSVVNDVYKEFFTHDFPARTAYQVGNLPLNAKVEIEVIALTGNVKCISSPLSGCTCSH